jgi:hypothetical protein
MAVEGGVSAAPKTFGVDLAGDTPAATVYSVIGNYFGIRHSDFRHSLASMVGFRALKYHWPWMTTGFVVATVAKC